MKIPLYPMNEYPKNIVVFPGILRPVGSREEEERVMRQNAIITVFIVIFTTACIAIGTGFLIAGFYKFLTR